MNAGALSTSARTLGARLLRSGLTEVVLFQFQCIAGSQRVIAAAADPIPVLAYYYIWFDVSSWNRAKMDYPSLVRYSSDDENVMWQHIQWAKAAGIDGFIVSWKSTEKLNRRLGQIIQLADREDFKLVIIYQGLDFERNPLPVQRVAADLDYFLDHFADHEAFVLFERPVVIWSGTWKFSREEIASVTEERRDHLLILASEKNTKGYERLADIVDGNAYYWSSFGQPGHVSRLCRETDGDGRGYPRQRGPMDCAGRAGL